MFGKWMRKTRPPARDSEREEQTRLAIGLNLLLRPEASASLACARCSPAYPNLNNF